MTIDKLEKVSLQDILNSVGMPVYIEFPEKMQFVSGWYITRVFDGSVFASNGFNTVSVKGVSEMGAQFYIFPEL